MYLIGLTGGIGTGKSTVSNYLKSKNIPVIDSDRIARQVVEPGGKCWKLIRDKFGPGVIDNETDQINRAYLAEIIFGDPEKRKLLNAITHPEIQKRMLLKIIYYFLTFHSFVVLDIPLLFEASKFRKLMSYVIVIKCDQEEQLKRIKSRNGYSDEEAWSRIRAQLPLEQKCQMADFVIDNNGTIDETLSQVEELLKKKLKHPPVFYLMRSLLILIYLTIVTIMLLILFKLLFKLFVH